ncbi:MAG: hypothetical protein ACRDPJ_01410 [Nocardioidaceae bacterium]
MPRLSDPRHLRKLAAGVALIAAPLVLLVGAVIHPQVEDAAAEHLAVAADAPDRYYVAHSVLLAGLVLFVPALLGLVHLLEERAPAFGHVGAGLATLGLFGATAVVAVDGIAVSQMARSGMDAGVMTALLDDIKESGGLRGIAIVGAVAFLVGVLLLAYGLWRAKAVQAWIAGGIAAAAIAVFIAQVADHRLIFVIAFALYLVALGPLGWKILTESDEDWTGNLTGYVPPLRPSGAG